MALSAAPFSVRAVTPTCPQLDAVKSLGRKHGDTLGFFPAGAYEDHAARGHLVMAQAHDGSAAGYCAFRVSKGRAMIAHLCVAEAFRGKGIARLLFEDVKSRSQQRDLRGIGLHCRRDYPVYDMWPKLGFAPIGSKQGRGADGAELTFWWYDLHAKDLLSSVEDADDRLRVVIDCNVFRDLHDTTEERNQEAKFLRADWLSGQIELCVVNELFIELDRISLSTSRESLKRAARCYRSLEHDARRAHSIWTELKTLFGHPAPTNKQASDMRHVAMSAAAEAEVFLTRDDEVLSHAAEINKCYGVQIMRPVDLISRLNETEQAALYQPARFASTDIQKARPRPEDVDGLAENLHVPSQRETRVQFAAKLRTILCDVQQNTVIAAKAENVPLFLIAHRQIPKRCEIPILRCNRTALASTSLRHAILQLIADAANLGGGQIIVRDALLSEEVQVTLHELGFRIGTNGWEKTTLRFLGNALAFDQALKAINQSPATDCTTAEEIEAQYWPAKLIGAGVHTWAVAIQPGWATELFETTFADGMLLHPKRELILSRENVYYSAAIQSGMEGATGRLLWYVSKDKHQPGSQTIRACSRLLEVRRGPAKILFNEFRRLGVFEWRDILTIANGDPNKEILALRFADTELFETPFPGDKAKALGIRNNFTGPVKAPETAFLEIYRQGMKVSVQS